MTESRGAAARDAREPGEHPAPRRGLPRWPAAAAALALVAVLGAWSLGGGAARVPAEPAATAPVPRVNPLVGATWMLRSVLGRPARPAGDSVPYLQFRADGRFSGGDPCNGVGGTYRLSGAVGLRLGLAPMTEIGCDTDQQARFLAALQATRQLRRDGAVLELLDGSASVVAVFAASAPARIATTPPGGPAPSPGPDAPTGATLPASGVHASGGEPSGYHG